MSIASCGLDREPRLDVSSGTIPKDVLAIKVSEFARLVSISVAQVYCEIAEGRLVARKAGGRTLIMRDDAELWIRRLPMFVSGRGTGLWGANKQTAANKRQAVAA